MSDQEENWILFEGAFVVPASVGLGIISKVIPVKRAYNRPLEIDNESMTFRIVPDEQITVMRAKKKIIGEASE